jgi:membrane protein
VQSKLAAFGQFVRGVARRVNDDHCMQIAGSLTFTTLLGLVPLVTVALTVISAFPLFHDMNRALQQFVVQNMVPESAEAIATYTEQFRANAAKLTALGLAFLIATAVMLMLTIEHAFNQIWRVTRPRPILQRAIIYWTLLTVGPVLIGASLSLTSWLVSRSLGLVSDIPGAGVALLKTVPVMLTALALALLYLAMPNRRIALRDALIGGVLAGLVFEASKRGFGWYLSEFPTYKMVYGAFSTVPIFLLWIYLSWLIVVMGAVVVAVLPEWRARSLHGRAAPGSDFLDAVRILKALWDARQKGEVVRLARLHAGVRASIERLEGLLDAMAEAGWVARAGRDRWELAGDPAAITLEEVYRLFVFTHDALAAGRDPELEKLTLEIGMRAAAHMQLTLGELFRPATPVVQPEGAPPTPQRTAGEGPPGEGPARTNAGRTPGNPTRGDDERDQALV